MLRHVRGTSIPAYLLAGGELEMAQRLAGHTDA